MPVEIAGRRAWEFVLAPPPHKPHPLRVAIDDETGAVLRVAVPDPPASVVEVLEIEVDQGVDPEVFRWDGPVAEDHVAEMAQDDASQRWFDQHQVPVPRYWAAGVSHMPMHADPATGAFSVYLMVPDEPVLLARWLRDGQPPYAWAQVSEEQHVHRWVEGEWEWALAVRSPLSPEELARVRASFPEPPAR